MERVENSGTTFGTKVWNSFQKAVTALGNTMPLLNGRK